MLIHLVLFIKVFFKVAKKPTIHYWEWLEVYINTNSNKSIDASL